MSTIVKGYPIAELRWTIARPVPHINPHLAVQVDHGARAQGSWTGETGEVYPAVRFEAWVDRSLSSVADAIELGSAGPNPEGMLRLAHSVDEGRHWDRIETAMPVGENELLKLPGHMTAMAIEMQVSRCGPGPAEEPVAAAAPAGRSRRLG